MARKIIDIQKGGRGNITKKTFGIDTVVKKWHLQN